MTTPDITPWLDAHEHDLDLIASDSGLEPGVVRLAAVLVLARLTDEEIYDQLRLHLPAVDGFAEPLAAVPVALRRIHALEEAA